MSGAGFAGREPRSGPRDPVLWLVLGLGFALRAAPVLGYPRPLIWRDERLHYVMSVVAANVEQHVLGHWPPGYELFLGAVFRAAGPEIAAARWLQVLLSTLAVALVYALARRAGGPRAGRIAGLLCALHPGLAAYPHYLYSETLFTTLLLAAAWLLFRAPGPPRARDAALGGLLFGLAALTRSLALYFLPVWLAWAALRRRPGELRRAALVLAVALATVAPWTLRNAVLLHEFILLDTTAGRTAWWAYNEAPFNEDLGHQREAAWQRNREKCPEQPHPRRAPLAPVRQLRELFPPDAELDARTAERLDFEIFLIQRYAVRDLLAYQRCELSRAANFVAARPGTALARVAQRAAWFWAPNSLLLRSVRWRSYDGGFLGPASYPFWKGAVWLSHVAVVLCALLALLRRGGPPLREWIALLSVYAWVLHSLTLAASRYRLPLEPFLIVLASLWLSRPGWPETRARRVTALAVGALFVLWAAYYGAAVLP